MEDLTGFRFGRLVVVGFDKIQKNGKSWKYVWKCKCDCGKTKSISRNSLGRDTFSCGCLHIDNTKLRNTTHGYSQRGHRSKTYSIWLSMRDRCSNSRSTPYLNYGARGISVDPRWDDFQNFIQDMGERPIGCSLDRINPDGNYKPSNCRWVSFRKQVQNRKKEIFLQHLIYNSGEGFSANPAFLS